MHGVLSTLPPADPTNPTSTTTFAAQTAIHNTLPILEDIVEILEFQEEETLKKEVEKRRTRLGAAGPEIIKREVGREIWNASKVAVFTYVSSLLFTPLTLQLPRFYDDILNHPNTSDDLRRLTDSKLLRYKERHLHALPDTAEFSSEKATLLKELDELVNGVIVLRIPDELAWMIFLEAQDCDSVGEFNSQNNFNIIFTI